MTLEEVVSGIPDFSTWKHADKIRFFAWFLHFHKDQSHFSAADIRSCYDSLHLEKPSDVNPFLAHMEQKRPKEVIRSTSGYTLERRLREDFESKYGQRVATIQVHQLLSTLPSRIPNLVEQTFLNEALICFRYGAFRAAMVMTWNLAFHHLCDFILRKHLATFNAQWPKRFQKLHANSRISSIASMDDFAELKESEVIEICRSANIVSNDIYKILSEKLGKRNTAAHPSGVVVTQLQAESFIDDLINNVVLRLQ